MTQVFADDGTVYPVTLVQAGPCTITQVKTPEKDGYCRLADRFWDEEAKKCKPSDEGPSGQGGKRLF